MEPNDVYRPTYRRIHRDFAIRRNRCARTLEQLEDKHGVYAEEIRRCERMYDRALRAIEEDAP